MRDGLDDGEVAVEDRVKQQRAETVQIEDLFDDDRAADEEGDVDSEQGQRRDERVARDDGRRGRAVRSMPFARAVATNSASRTSAMPDAQGAHQDRHDRERRGEGRQDEGLSDALRRRCPSRRPARGAGGPRRPQSARCRTRRRAARVRTPRRRGRRGLRACPCVTRRAPPEEPSTTTAKSAASPTSERVSPIRSPDQRGRREPDRCRSCRGCPGRARTCSARTDWAATVRVPTRVAVRRWHRGRGVFPEHEPGGIARLEMQEQERGDRHAHHDQHRGRESPRDVTPHVLRLARRPPAGRRRRG